MFWFIAACVVAALVAHFVGWPLVVLFIGLVVFGFVSEYWSER